MKAGRAITIRVILFAGLTQSEGGRSEQDLTVQEGSTVGDAMEQLRQMLQRTPPPSSPDSEAPASSSRHALLTRSAAAVNERYAPITQVLHPGDTLAIIPPVSGG